MGLEDVELNFEDEDAAVPECVALHFVQTDENVGLHREDLPRALSCLERAIDRAKLAPARLYGAPPPVKLAAVGGLLEAAQRAASASGGAGNDDDFTALLQDGLGDEDQAGPMPRVQSSLGMKTVSNSRRSSRSDLQGMARD